MWRNNRGAWGTRGSGGDATAHPGGRGIGNLWHQPESECIPSITLAAPPAENWMSFPSPLNPKVSKMQSRRGDRIHSRRSPDQIARTDPLSGMIARLRSLFVGGMLFLAAAGPVAPLPLPPTPPAGGPLGHAAPIPDLFASRPTVSPPSRQPSFGPAWLSSRRTQQSQGFIPGSQVETRPDRRTELAPGISLQLPLH